MTLDQFIGIPYARHGSGFSGCDCWGLVWLFHRETLGNEIPRYEGYVDPEHPSIGRYIEERWGNWISVGLPNIELGDVLAFRVGGLPVHCGVYAGHGKMLHVLEGRMSCLESVTRGYWKNAIVRIGRWKS